MYVKVENSGINFISTSENIAVNTLGTAFKKDNDLAKKEVISFLCFILGNFKPND